MKIAFVIHDINAFGGQERSTLEIVNRFAKTEQVHVYANSSTGLSPGITNHLVPCLIRRPLFLKDFFFRIFSTLMLLGRGYDLVHITGTCAFKADIVTVQFCQRRWAFERKKLRAPFSLRRLIQDIQVWSDVFWESLVFFILKQKRFIALSETVAQDLRDYYRIPNVSVIPHGVDFQEFRPNSSDREVLRRENGVKPEEIVILFVGTFERKGLFNLISALKTFDRPFRLFVVGQGPQAKAEELLKAAGLEGKAIFFGHRKDVERYYRAADMFVLPSLYDPFGLVGIEALATGLPSIVSRASGVSQHIENGVNGYVIENADSVQELANALVRLGADLKTRDLSKAARDSVKASQWNDIFPEYSELFSRIVKT
jgi:UDP-glucose:(heptosyl)LPS alpha-1,3-glucosyltransferase